MKYIYVLYDPFRKPFRAKIGWTDNFHARKADISRTTGIRARGPKFRCINACWVEITAHRLLDHFGLRRPAQRGASGYTEWFAIVPVFSFPFLLYVHAVYFSVPFWVFPLPLLVPLDYFFLVNVLRFAQIAVLLATIIFTIFIFLIVF